MATTSSRPRPISVAPPPDRRHAATGDALRDEDRPIGKGRAGTVYRDRAGDGTVAARKVFEGETASKLVLCVLTGAGNPYGWCGHAVRAAAHRRRVLEHLVRHWFGERLRLPRTLGSGWNERHRAYELRTEWIDGRHAALPGPDDDYAAREIEQLVGTVMKPLQRRLRESGFDGLLWQTGLGNPVASSNFMLERVRGRAAADLRWVWIDLESGVPALFAMNPLATLGTYLPASWRHRNWLFDDVDLARLRAYVEAERETLETQGGWDELTTEIEHLAHHQRAWKSLGRMRRGIDWSVARGRLEPDRADWYARRPVRWHVRLVTRGVRSVVAGAWRRIRRLVGRVVAFRWRRLFGRVSSFCVSQQFRTFTAQRYVARRIGGWRRRGFLTRLESREMRHELRGDEASEYITDFGVHIAIKPIIKGTQWIVFPALFAAGVLSPLGLALLIGMGGAIGRTLYTMGRMVQATVRRQRRPWIALLVGSFPVIGNGAYPIQLVYSAGHHRRLARFILDDTFATFGRALPIWGGADTLTEHWFSRLPAVALRVLSWLGRLAGARPAETPAVAPGPASPGSPVATKPR